MTSFRLILILAIATVTSIGAKPIIPRQAGGQGMTGLTVVSNLQSLSLVYQDLTFAVNNLESLKNQSDPDAIVAQYANLTNSEDADEAAPQPSVAVDDFDQYGILNAQFNLVQNDRAFLNALSTNKQFFNSTLRATIRNLLSEQINVLNTFDKDIAAFAPDVVSATNANSGVLLAALQGLLATFF
ncbi:hypothetical protein ACLMJK_007604 [Lecanora helva]